ncbi:pentapeptide repeat-containing protein [Brevundimonas sp.]|uniref:pentapeptide repeat-containing protein n=1 Tax=Brevundimonas sp. TaxID=1871086 RepID=UPI003F709C8A
MVKETDSAADREARRWAEWFSADFSWDGLSRHIIPTGGLHGEKTLQDYWRRDPATGVSRDDAAMRDAGQLIDFDGRTWHLAHLPPRGRTGSATSSKANPDHPDFAGLAALVATRVAAGVETSGFRNLDGYKFSGPDGRARLDGAVLGPSPNHPDGSASPLHLSCRHTWFGQAEFEHSRFGPGADFESATFTDVANFESATFTGDAFFASATFTGVAFFASATFTGDARFYGATFIGGAYFYSATFTGGAYFYSATFTGDAYFYSATFTDVANFASATFTGGAYFARATFTGGAFFASATFTGDAHFHSAVFLGPVSFAATIANPQRQFAGAFLGARFAALADFSGAGGEGRGGLLAAAFGGAQFEKGLLLTDGLDKAADKIFPELLGGAEDAAWAELVREKKGRAARKEKFGCRERNQFRKNAERRRLVELESGCRTLKVAMGAARDEVREQRYYRFQLRARHNRSGVSGIEKFFGWLYGRTSNYGSGLWGPILSLGVLTFASGLGYWAWAAHYGVAGDQGFWEGQSFALSVVFKPFAVLAATTSDPAVRDWWPVALMNVSASVAWGLRGVTTLQSLASGVLIFLLAVGVRRRFQIG